MKLELVREAKVYVDSQTNEQKHRLGYAMILLLHSMKILKPGESMPEGIFSATGDGEIPGMRKHLVGDAMLIGYVEKFEDGRRADDPNTVFARLTPYGMKAAENHEVVGIDPPQPISILKRRLQRLIEQDRARKAKEEEPATTQRRAIRKQA